MQVFVEGDLRGLVALVFSIRLRRVGQDSAFAMLFRIEPFAVKYCLGRRLLKLGGESAASGAGFEGSGRWLPRGPGCDALVRGPDNAVDRLFAVPRSQRGQRHQIVDDLLGEQPIKSESVTWDSRGGSLFSPSRQVSERDRALINVDELRRLPEHVVLMVQGRLRPMVISTIPWIDKPWATQAIASRQWHTDNPAGPDGAPIGYHQRDGANR